MSDELRLLGVIALIYLVDCVYWIPRNGISLARLAGQYWRLRFPSAVLGNQRGGIGLANPLPPLGMATRAQGLPISISPHGVLSFISAGYNEGGRPPQETLFYPWDQVTKIEREGRTIFINERPFYKAVSGYAARAAAEAISQARNGPPDQRERSIREVIAQSFSLKQLRERIASHSLKTRLLRRLGNLLFFFLFVAVPATVAVFGLPRAIWIILVCLFAQTITIAILFRRAHRQLYPSDRDEIFKPFLTMILAPPSAIRAADLLCRPLLESFHPLAAGAALSSKAAFQRFAGRVFRDLAFPRLPILPPDFPAPAHACESWARHEILHAAENLLREAGLTPANFLAPPAPSDPAHEKFCPRCLQQFTGAATHCPDCGGLELRLLDLAHPSLPGVATAG